jgi:shikimate dehydrogenase
VLGDPLAFTLSPRLHIAGLAALGLPGDSEAMRVPVERLGGTLERLAAAGYRGANLTHPLKEAALAYLTVASEPARRARSVNTVLLEPGGAHGETTDGPGLLDLLAHQGFAPGGARATLLGAGGAARSLALSLLSAGAAVTVVARRPAAARAAWAGIAGAHLVGWASDEARAALARPGLVVNATPLAEEPGPWPLDEIAPGSLVVDLVYGAEPTPWIRAARAQRRPALDGLGLLVFQARRSLALWTGREVPLEPLARAVGWPR